MNTRIEIDKRAFIARINELRSRPVIDSRFDVINGSVKLILVHENGSEEIFKGFRRAA